MSTFSNYNTLIEQKIANTSEVFYDEEMKRQAANDAILELVHKYTIPELTVRSTLAFSSGIATPPADLFRLVKLWDVDANGVELNRYLYIDPNEFDQLADTAAYYWTEDYNVSAGARRYLIKPTSVTSLNIRYVKEPTSMTDSSSDSGLSTTWDEAVVYITASKLFQISNRYQEASEYERIGWQRANMAIQHARNPGGVKSYNRLKSKYEEYSQLGINSVTSINI